MTQELFNHLKQVEPGRTVVPMYFIRRPLGWPDAFGKEDASDAARGIKASPASALPTTTSVALGTPETESDKLDGTSPSTELPQMKGGET